MKKVRLRIDRILIVLIIFVILIVGLIYLLVPKKEKMIDMTQKEMAEIEKYVQDHQLNLEIKEEYNPLEQGKIISQSIPEGTVLHKEDTLMITVSKGLDYASFQVNELGNVPIMMYHGIHDITDNKYTGGNVDKDGYQRTASAFRNDLKFYYENGYRMIRLQDYIDGIIDTEAGKSPIILTFDDGLANAIKVTGLTDNGDLIIDPNSAVGILEEFKNEHPDMQVTATFFVNGGLFQQEKYNEKILHYLIEHGYDIGNHSWSHADFTKISYEQSVKEIGSLYNLLDEYIPNQYVEIVAMPFGSPYKKSHENFQALLSGTYNGKEYQTKATLQVGWKASTSPFVKSFDSSFLTRIRAYDNNGNDWDIEYNFKLLEKNKYISDGNKETVAFPKEKGSELGQTNLKVIAY